MILHIFNQQHDFSCGIACVAMLVGLKKKPISEQYTSCINFIFPKIIESQLNIPNVNLRSKIGQLQLYLSSEGIFSNRFKLKGSSPEQFDRGVSIVLIHADQFLHWVLIFKIENTVYVVDPEEKNAYEFKEYFSHENYAFCLNRMHLFLPDVLISNIVSAA